MRHIKPQLLFDGVIRKMSYAKMCLTRYRLDGRAQRKRNWAHQSWFLSTSILYWNRIEQLQDQVLNRPITIGNTKCNYAQIYARIYYKVSGFDTNCSSIRLFTRDPSVPRVPHLHEYVTILRVLQLWRNADHTIFYYIVHLRRAVEIAPSV